MTKPKYSVGDVVYIVYGNKIIKTKISRKRVDPDVKTRFAYQTEETGNCIRHHNIYPTPESIIAHLL